jgi:hypothetical protein
MELHTDELLRLMSVEATMEAARQRAAQPDHHQEAEPSGGGDHHAATGRALVGALVMRWVKDVAGLCLRWVTAEG